MAANRRQAAGSGISETYESNNEIMNESEIMKASAAA